MLDWKRVTYGAELELADIDTRLVLPATAVWDYREYSIRNSNGTSVDPKKRLNAFGSEVHTVPCRSVSSLLGAIEDTYKHLKVGHRCFNHTTSLHFHVQIPGLSADLSALKKLIRYIRQWDTEIYENIDPIRFPEDGTDRHFFLQRKRWHHSRVSAQVYQKLLSATSAKEFISAHAPQHRGIPQWHLMQRAGINLAHLAKPSNTVEFRCFTMSLDLDRVRQAALWVSEFIPRALDNERPRFPNDLQRCYPHNTSLDRIYYLTNIHKQGSRGKVLRNYEALFRTKKLTRAEVLG